jgi:MFS family permease
MCIAEVLGMLGISMFSALLPEMQAAWSLSNSAAGWITGIFFLGFLLAVPVLVSLTDRVDTRWIYLLSTALGGVCMVGFALLAEGFWSAMVFRTLAGVALAGTYMPGLKALTDRVSDAAQPRAVAFYTSSFGIGASLSFFIAGEVAAVSSWHWAFGVAAICAPLAMALAGWALTARPGTVHPAPDHHLLDFRPVFLNREAMGYILAYTAHNWELFGFRGWLVAFLFFSQGFNPDYSHWNVTAIVAVLVVLATPASIIGGELAVRFGRRRMVTGLMTTSAFLAAIFGFAGVLPFPLVIALAAVYSLFVSADSSAITAGAVRAAPANGRGAVMAVHSCLGFMGAFLGPLAFGVVLDIAGADHLLGWGLAFGAMGLGVLTGPLLLAAMGNRRSEG